VDVHYKYSNACEVMHLSLKPMQMLDVKCRSEYGGIYTVLHRVIDQYFCALESVLGYKSLYLTVLYFLLQNFIKAEYGCRLEFNKCVIKNF